MLRVSILFLFFIPFFIACNNDDENTPAEPEIALYNIKVGNEWTYDYYRRVSNDSDVFDKLTATSKVVVSDYEEIGDDIYFILEETTTNSEGPEGCVPGNGTVITKVKDSLGYLIDLEGKILFSTVNTEPYLVSDDTWGDIYRELNTNTVAVETIFGTVNTIDNRRYAILSDGEESTGSDNKYLLEDVGFVLETASYVSSSQHTWEKRLTSFSEN